MSQNQLDIVTVCVLIATALFSPKVGSIVGPYLVIVFASTIGASFALARRVKSTRLAAAFFFVRIVGLAVLLTAALSTAAGIYRAELGGHVLLGPIAFLIGFIGDDTPEVLRWAAAKLNKLIDALIKLRTGGD